MAKHRGAGQAATRRGKAVNNRGGRERILIVCEGEKTEPNYFKSLIAVHKLNTVALEVVVEGAGRVTQSLVTYAEELQKKAGGTPYKEIWCVFDKDSFPDADFDNAIAKTRNHPFLRAAWSNEAFELWYVLHFEYLNSAPARGGTPRAYYTDRLNHHAPLLGRQEYRKNDDTLYDALGMARLREARRNARKLLTTYDEATPCHDRKPATMVFELVERLLSYAPDNPLEVQI